MCEFLSAVKVVGKSGKDKYYFLTYNLIHNTPRGKLLQKKYGGDDLIGHGAIRDYFELKERGENWEQTDFSTPDNFPPEIIKALVSGEFRGFITGNCLPLLTSIALQEYKKREPAYAEWEKIDAVWGKRADAVWEKKADTLWEKADAEKHIFWDLFAIKKNRNPKWRKI